MPNVGDQIMITIEGGEKGTTLGGAIKIGPGASMRTPARIIEDRGDHWLIALSISFNGNNELLVSKSAVTD